MHQKAHTGKLSDQVLARPGSVAAGALEEMPQGCFSALVVPEIPLATSDAENALAPRRGGC